MKPFIRNLAVLASVIMIGIATIRGSVVPFQDQWPLYEALRNTAAIIFAVIGAWLAIVFPERLKLSLRSGEATADDLANGQRVHTLMAPIVHSTFILAAVLAVGIAAPLIRDLEFVREHVEFFRGLSYGILTTLTLWQLWTVVLTLVPASEVSTQVTRAAAKQKTVAAVTSRSKK